MLNAYGSQLFLPIFFPSNFKLRFRAITAVKSYGKSSNDLIGIIKVTALHAYYAYERAGEPSFMRKYQDISYHFMPMSHIITYLCFTPKEKDASIPLASGGFNIAQSKMNSLVILAELTM